MSRVSKMSLNDILESIDLIMRENDIVYFCDNMDVVREFIQKYGGKPNKVREVKEFFIKNEKYIDKEKLVLLVVKNYKDNLVMIEQRKEELTKQFSIGKSSEVFSELSELQLQQHAQNDRLQTAMRIGKGMETFLTFYYYDEKEKKYKIEVADSRELIDGKKINGSKNLRRFDEIDLSFKNGNKEEALGMEFIIQSMLLTDLYRVFPSEHFGNDIRTMILENEVLKKGSKTREQLQELKTLENYEEYTTLLDNVCFEGMLPDIKETLREYAQYIDLDKLLLISAYRFNEGLENGYISPKMTLSAKEILKGILQNIKNPNGQISCELQRKRDNSYEMELIEYSTKDIKRCLTQFTKTGYVTTEEIEENRRKVHSQEINLSQVDSEYIDIIFSLEELEKLSTLSEENLLYVSQRNEWDTKKILNAIKNMGICRIETLTVFLEAEKISSSDVVELYESDIISVEDVKSLRDIVDLSVSINFDKLNEYYKELKNNREDEKLLNKFNKYLNLYKKVLLSDKSAEELQESSNIAIEEIVEEFEGEEYNEAIKKYYKAGIITLYSIADWSNENLITILLDEGLISLEDIEDLVRKQKLPFDYISNVHANLIKNDTMEYDERLRLIRKGFVKEDDIISLYIENLIFENDLRELAKEGFVREDEIQKVIDSRTMEELEKNSSIRLTGLNSLTKRNNEIYSTGSYTSEISDRRDKGSKLIIDPNERADFIHLLKAYRAETDLEEDSPFYNYEFYVIPDESGSIGLNSVVIAERYYEDKDTESRFATNNATYFFKYKDLMVLSNLRKSEMTKERKNIVFTANHVIANDKRDGYWARSVIEAVAKTMLSSDLKEYSKENQRKIVLHKLKEVYNPQELISILNMASEIDSGEYICEIEEPLSRTQRKKKVSENKQPTHNDDGSR